MTRQTIKKSLSTVEQALECPIAFVVADSLQGTEVWGYGMQASWLPYMTSPLRTFFWQSG